MSIKYIDLFAGVGGFRYGIESIRPIQQELSKRPDSDNNTENELVKWKCVYSNEWDKYANSVYKKHYERCDDRDIRTVPTSDIPDHDLLVGGFPCQAFSVAGKRGGFNDTRGTLFFEIARILRDKRPRYLLLENVKGLLSHDNGKTFQTILGVLSDIGYECQWQVLNSKDFRVPQNRERVFIIGNLRGEPSRKVFPITESNSENNKTQRKSNYTRTITTAHAHGSSTNMSYIKQLNNPTHSNNRVYGDDGISPTLNTMQGGQRQPKIVVPVLTPDRPEKRQNGRRFKEDGEPSFTLTAQDKHGIYDGVKIRRLTPVECERLQGFPDNWTKYGHDDKEMSDTQRYKMMGNAVTTNVVTAIIRKLI